ncbi:MAG: hypothetical protein V3S38_02130 [Acidimicrobiia bacterium]
MSWNTRTITDLEADLVAVEARISLLRGEQHVLVNELDTALDVVRISICLSPPTSDLFVAPLLTSEA